MHHHRLSASTTAASASAALRSLAITALCLLATSVHAAATLDGFQPGSHVSGPKFDAADLTGRVVLVEYWGVNCPPCLASIPHISALQEKYGRDQFIIIANHCQAEDNAKAAAVFKSRGGSDLITVINHGSLSGADVSGIPHCFLFNHDGKLVYEGSPSGLDAPVESAVKNSPGFLIAGRTYRKTQKQAATIGALRTNLSGTLKSLRTLGKSDDATAKEEADHLLGKVEEFAQRNLAKITSDRSDDPITASETLARMVHLLGGDELGAPFEALVKDLKADKAFQAELKAAAILSDVCAQATKAGFDRNPEDARRNRQAVTQIGETLKALVKKFPDTKAASQAMELAKRWGI
jgi:thiol-disulfide isomerase/thioredoxin